MNNTQLCYTNGKKYRPAYGHGFTADIQPSASPALLDRYKNQTWPQFWNILYKELENRGYERSSITLYRQVLRKLRDFGITNPGMVNAARAKDYIIKLTETSASWSWVGTNISVLRNTFDKLGGRTITSGLSTPKRPKALPTILSSDEVEKILESAPSIRDQLLLGLMYGCGLKVGEVCRLRWQDVDLPGNMLNVRHGENGLPPKKHRKLSIPQGLVAVLARGVSECPPDGYIFQGRKKDTHLSIRMAELILRKAVRKTEIPKVISCMTLRHTYAVHQLENHINIREIQEQLGHKSVETTLPYQRCILPKLDKTPLGLVRELMRKKSDPDRTESGLVSTGLPHQAKAHRAGWTLRKPRQAKTSPLSIPKTSSLEGLQLPFVEDNTLSLKKRSWEFYQTLKIRLRERFLT